MPERDFLLGRMKFVTLLDNIAEDVGTALEIEGAVAAPGARGTRGLKIEIPIHGAFDDPDPYAAGLMIRRQARALFNNDLLQTYGLYLNWVQDPELNAWIIAGRGELAYREGGITLSEFGLTIDDVIRVGGPRTHREARRAEIYDRRLSTTPRDLLGQNYSIDFASLTPLPVIFLPVGATDIYRSPGPLTPVLRTGIDGSTPAVAAVHGAVYGYELAEASRNKGDVVILDRKTFTAPTYTAAGDLAPQDTYGWEEIYGPDQPLTAGDVPVLQNSQCRVRYDATNTPGFRVDLYDATTSKYLEQGKVIFFRNTAGAGMVDTLVSASVVEWTPERGVIRAVMRDSDDPVSRETVYITLQRGWTGPRVELYPSPHADGTPVEAGIFYTVADADTAVSLVKVDTGNAGKIISSTTPGFVGGSTATTFTGENWIALLRQGRPYSVVLAYLQAGLTGTLAPSTVAYGTSRYELGVRDLTGWQCVQIGYLAQASDQVLEAEAIRNTGSGTTSQVADALATNGQCVRDTQTTAATPTLVKNPSNLRRAKHRVFARVRTNGGTGNFAAVFDSAVIGSTVNLNTSGNFQWVDLGDLSPTAATTRIEIDAWRGTGTSVDVDRVEVVRVEDRTAAAPTYDGARDLGQMALYDARAVPALVTRG